MWDCITTKLPFDARIHCVIFNLFDLVKSYNLAFLLFIIIPSLVLFWFLRVYFHTVYDEKQNTSTNRNLIKILYSHSISFFNKRFLLVLLPLLSTFFVFLADAYDKRVDRASNAVAQAEFFLREQYSNQERIEDYNGKLYYYGSAVELRESLEYLHKNKRKFTYLYLPRTDLGNTNFSGTKLQHANFSHAYLGNANFSQADLAKANLIGSKLSKANLSRADLYGAKFNRANMKEANLTGAVITATDFTGAKNLTTEQIKETCWLKAKLYEIDGKKEVIIADPPMLPDYLKDFNVHELPEAKLGGRSGDLAYCP